MLGIALKYYNRTTTGRRYNCSHRSKLIDIRTTADFTAVYIIRVIILNVNRCIISRIPFNGNITLVAQINHFLINTIIQPEYFLCI